MTGNLAVGNSVNGFFLDGNGGGCSGNTLTESVGRANAQWDAFDGNAPAANTWSNNKLGTTNPPGL